MAHHLVDGVIMVTTLLPSELSNVFRVGSHSLEVARVKHTTLCESGGRVIQMEKEVGSLVNRELAIADLSALVRISPAPPPKSSSPPE